MTEIGVPGSPDGPSAEPLGIGEVVVTFRGSGPPSVRWSTIAGRTHREVMAEAARALQKLLDDDGLDKLEGDPPREPPF